MRAWLFVLTFLFSSYSFAQVQVFDEVDPRSAPNAQTQPQTPQPVGKKHAETYFKARQSNSRAPAGTDADRYLMLMIGGVWNEEVYKWGNSRNQNIGKFMAGVTYRIGEWVNSMDMMVRADINTFSLDEGRAVKLSLLPLIVFPDATSRFPMYFGAGVGPGIFFKQIRNESSVSLDYQIFAGARFFDLYENMGFVFEAGLKNSIMLFSDGQYNSVYTTVGAVFTF